MILNQHPLPSKQRRVLALSGTPYAGKSLMLSRLAKEDLPTKIKCVRRVTTRRRRLTEDEAPEYHFVDRTTFKDMKQRGEFFFTEYNFGEHYGVRVDDLVAVSNDETVLPILVTNVRDGFSRILDYFEKPAFVFVSPVTLDSHSTYEEEVLRRTLERRICNRPCRYTIGELMAFCRDEYKRLSQLRHVDLHVLYNRNGEQELERSYALFRQIVTHLAERPCSQST